MGIDPQKLAIMQAARSMAGNVAGQPGAGPMMQAQPGPAARPPMAQQQPPLPEFVQRLQFSAKQRNLAEFMEEDELSKIGERAYTDYEIDKRSRSEWDDMVENIKKQAGQVKEPKTFPWAGAANIKYPLITVGAVQFASRAYPEIVTGPILVKCEVQGKVTPEKEERAKRVARHMSWQLLRKQPEWEEETDRLLHDLPIIGMGFRKTYFDPVIGRPMSKYCPAEDVYIHHQTRSMIAARRITHAAYFWENEIRENINKKAWLDVDLPPATAESPGDEQDAARRILEQHRWLDLDEDGYEEPYIVTLDEETHKVLRILARFEPNAIEHDGDKIIRIEPVHYFTKYGFLPNPDGGFYDIGLGMLLFPLNESINGVINQLLDAGTLQNTGGGLITREARAFGRIARPIKRAMGTYIPVDISGADLRRGIHDFPTHEPSPVLFQLLGLLIEAARDIAGIKDVLTGDMPQGNVPATTVVAMIEQGLKVYSAIHKRIYRSLTHEYQKRYLLNSKYMKKEEYFMFQDDQQLMAAPDDYNPMDMDIMPVADPQYSSSALRMAKAQALLQIIQAPGIKAPAVTRRYVDALDVPNPEQIVMTQDEIDAQQKPAQAMQQQAAMLNLEMMRADIVKRHAEIEGKKARAMLDLAKAEGEKGESDLKTLEALVEMLDGVQDAADQMMETMKGGLGGDNQGRVPELAGQPGNAGISQ